ncbi:MULTISPECIES: helix-turn-helix transcriptional regulator [Comamonas]|uniref:helix-turn-helix transcriptional regulator n=1 Tax=Comamonas TaxID=283 RepID=UPI001CBF0679|nr:MULTISPECIES: helix-turn-helix transcriptional regulator [Comamonas]
MSLSVNEFPDQEISIPFLRALFHNFPNGNFQANHLMSTIQTTEQLGAALRTARKQLGLTQPQLALAAGVGTRFIVDLESGKPTVRLEHVLRVIDALGGELQLGGLPYIASEGVAEGARHGA